MSAPETDWEIRVDGTAAPNPGRIGIGIVLVSPDGAVQEVSRALGHSGCNNEAEVRAVAAALALAAAAGARRPSIRSDSRFAVDCLNGADTTDVPRLATLLAETRAAMASFEAVHLAWFPSRRNADADRLARAALGLPARPDTPPPRRRR